MTDDELRQKVREVLACLDEVHSELTEIRMWARALMTHNDETVKR